MAEENLLLPLLFFTCDRTVKIWVYSSSLPLFFESVEFSLPDRGFISSLTLLHQCLICSFTPVVRVKLFFAYILSFRLFFLYPACICLVAVFFFYSTSLLLGGQTRLRLLRISWPAIYNFIYQQHTLTINHSDIAITLLVIMQPHAF